MKYIVILGDGMADEAIPSLGGRTPLQAAKTPYMDYLAANGKCGMFHTVPEGFAPGSEIANLSVLGYDVAEVFEGRGSLEAASMGVEIADGEMVMRCNLITIEQGRIKNHSAGHISTGEAVTLINYLSEELFQDDGNITGQLFPGVSYRHLIKLRGADKRVRCSPPHDVCGTPYRDVLPVETAPEGAETADLLRELTECSQTLLDKHPINIMRVEAGKEPANSIWPWSAGYRPRMARLSEKYPIRSSSVISAVDLIKGIGVYAGLTPIEVEGATGLYDTNYEGKAAAAVEALRTEDFVFLHVEASDEAGHEGNVGLKVRTIEFLDDRIVRPIVEEIGTWDEPVTVAVLPDHPTPCALRTHTRSPVPFIIYRPGNEADFVRTYDELSAAEGSYGTLSGDGFIRALFEL